MTPLDIFNFAIPRADVLSDNLTDAVFAASLAEIINGSAPEAYADPQQFFAATHPSAGLRILLDEALGRATGARADAAPVIRLETNLGGGKTHTLIALYHAARGGLSPDLASDFMDSANLPAKPIEQVAAFVGTEESAIAFPKIAGISPHSPWGYIALQLAGKRGYEQVRAADESRTSPGSRDIKKVLNGQPSLVLIDELARFLQSAEGVSIGNSTLADQTVAFVMSLMEAAASETQTCVILTTTETTDPFGGDTEKLTRAFDEAQELINRRALSLRPSDEADLPRILARRLFESIDPDAPAAIAASYAEVAQDAHSRGTDLPEKMVGGSGWQSEVEASYPFHPDLVQILDKRLSTIPNFQRTRGALRLLAKSTRLLWDERPENTLLIHAHHVDLGNSEVAEELSSRLDRPRFEPVIRADISSRPGADPAHSEQVDTQMGAPYAKRLATTAYLYSLTAETPGVSAPELIGGVLAPGDDSGIVTKALDQLEQACWYLHTDVRGYRFSTEASLVKLVVDAEQRIPLGKVKQAATTILAHQFRDAALKVKRAWEDPKIADNSDDAYLVIFHWDELQIDDPEGPVPSRIQEVWEKAPAGGNRTYRNRLVFLAPTADGHEPMIRSVRHHMALEDLSKSDVLADLTPEKRAEVKQKARESELEARIGVCNHVNVLYVPETGGLQGSRLDMVTQASVKENQTEAVIDRLSAMEKTLAAGDKPLDPLYIASKVGTQLDDAMTTEALVHVFAQRSDLKLVLDKGRIRDLVGDGVRTGAWEYHDPERGESGWATKGSPNTAFRIAADSYIYPVGSAPPVAPAECPLCGDVHSGPCAASEDDGPGTPVGDLFEGSGAAAVAVQGAKQSAIDAGRGDVRRLQVLLDASGEGTGADLARLLALIPQQDATLTYRVDATVELGLPEHKLRVEFVGPPSEYQPVKAVLDQILRAKQAVLRASIEAVLEPPWALSGQEVEDLHRRATETGPSTCNVKIYTEGD